MLIAIKVALLVWGLTGLLLMCFTRVSQSRPPGTRAGLNWFLVGVMVGAFAFLTALFTLGTEGLASYLMGPLVVPRLLASEDGGRLVVFGGVGAMGSFFVLVAITKFHETHSQLEKYEKLKALEDLKDKYRGSPMKPRLPETLEQCHLALAMLAKEEARDWFLQEEELHLAAIRAVRREVEERAAALESERLVAKERQEKVRLADEQARIRQRGDCYIVTGEAPPESVPRRLVCSECLQDRLGLDFDSPGVRVARVWDGEIVSSGAIRGRPTMVHTRATCGVCGRKREMKIAIDWVIRDE